MRTMTNLMVEVDDGVLQNAEKYAQEKGTTVDQLIQQYLIELAQQDERRAALEFLREALERSFVELGERTSLSV